MQVAVMGMFLDTIGNASLAIFICDRCRLKRPIDEQMPDPNFPGLRVCQQGCADQKDPYRLPARKTERINLRFPRPDVSVAVDPNNLVTDNQGNFIISTEGNTNIVENDGNLDGISITP
jgi:hypothetical protein